MAERTPDFTDDPLDRLAARSIAASERTQGRAPPPAKRSLLPWVLTTGAVAFSLGMIANPWFEASVRSRLPGQLQDPVAAINTADEARLKALEGRVATLEAQPTEAQPAKAQMLPAPLAGTVPDGLGARLSTLEKEVARLAEADLGVGARIDLLAATAGNSIAGQNQIKELFLLSAARRFVEVGRPFGAYERVLTQSFSGRDPAATDALAAWSSAPHSRDSLLARLREPDAVEPAVSPPAETGWWDRLVARLSGVVKVRSEDALASDPQTRQKAESALASGDLGLAIATFDLLPPSRTRDLWLADARRLMAAEQALDSLETQLLAVPPADPVPAVGATATQQALPPPPLNAPAVAAPVAPPGATTL